MVLFLRVLCAASAVWLDADDIALSAMAAGGKTGTARKGPYDIDVLRGQCAYGEDPVVSPTFVHFVRLKPREVCGRRRTSSGRR